MQRMLVACGISTGHEVVWNFEGGIIVDGITKYF